MKHWRDCAGFMIESIDKLYQVKEIAISVMRMTAEAPCDNFDEEMDSIITLVNSVLLNEAGARAVLYTSPHSE